MALKTTKQTNTSARRTQQRTLQSIGSGSMPVSFEFTTPNIIITFNQPVVRRGIPQYMTDTGKLPVSASLDATKTILTLVYDTPGAVTEVTIPATDRSITTFAGGVPVPGTFPTP